MVTKICFRIKCTNNVVYYYWKNVVLLLRMVSSDVT